MTPKALFQKRSVGVHSRYTSLADPEVFHPVLFPPVARGSAGKAWAVSPQVLFNTHV